MSGTITNEIPSVLQPVLDWPLVDDAREGSMSYLEFFEFLKAMEKQLTFFDGHHALAFCQRNVGIPIANMLTVRVTFGEKVVAVTCGQHLSIYIPIGTEQRPFGYEQLIV